MEEMSIIISRDFFFSEKLTLWQSKQLASALAEYGQWEESGSAPAAGSQTVTCSPPDSGRSACT